MAKHRRSKTARKVKGFGKISFFVLILSFAIFTALLVTAAVHMPKKSGNTVCIDAGHGGYDVGATNGEKYEKDDNLRLAAAGVDDGLGIVLEDIAHGGVFLLYRENAILFAGVEEIDEQERQVHRNILPDEGELKRHGTAPLSGYFDSLSYHETRQK